MTPCTKELHVDIETYSEIDLRKCGAYRYALHPFTKIILAAYAVGDEEVKLIDWQREDKERQKLLGMLTSKDYDFYAHNAAFEIINFMAVEGLDIDISRWHCTMAMASSQGLPASLNDVTSVLGVEESKLSTGVSLISWFCKPDKKGNRRLPEDHPEKWAEFRKYCAQDVRAERAVKNALGGDYKPTKVERETFLLDLRVNYRGVLVDMELVNSAMAIMEKLSEDALQELRDLTGMENPNSTPQFKKYLAEKGYPVKSFTKESSKALEEEVEDEELKRAIRLKRSISHASIKKYDAIARGVCPDGTIKGTAQYLGANRTGRWAGRQVQLQNLKRNEIKDLDLARELVKDLDVEALSWCYEESLPEILGQLIRTALVPSSGNVFIVSDFSAIEARVIAWLAGEKWKEEVFAENGDIYKSSYSKAFHVPIEEVGKAERQKGKIMELALGYGGSVGAMTAFGADKLGLSEQEIKLTVQRWRKANSRITRLWKDVENACLDAIELGKSTLLVAYKGLLIKRRGHCLVITLPSGRDLVYQKARIGTGKFGGSQVEYLGVNQTSRKYERTETHGGKLVENVVQAIARDLLADAMVRMDKEGHTIVAHVHDEVIVDGKKEDMKSVEKIMRTGPTWAKGLHLNAESYTGSYYFKD